MAGPLRWAKARASQRGTAGTGQYRQVSRTLRPFVIGRRPAGTRDKRLAGSSNGATKTEMLPPRPEGPVLCQPRTKSGVTDSVCIKAPEGRPYRAESLGPPRWGSRVALATDSQGCALGSHRDGPLGLSDRGTTTNHGPRVVLVPTLCIGTPLPTRRVDSITRVDAERPRQRSHAEHRNEVVTRPAGQAAARCSCRRRRAASDRARARLHH